MALFLAPYLRQFGQFTIPDFLGARYGGNLPRFIGILAAILCSFTYVVAQIYGVGLITSRLTGLGFEIGIFVGLGGILVCSFLGGMRAVTWTQVAQYIILIVAYMMPVIVAVGEADRQCRCRRLVYGYQLEKVTAARAAADATTRRRRRSPRSSSSARDDAGRQAQGRARGAGGRQGGGAAQRSRELQGGQCAGGRRSRRPRRHWRAAAPTRPRRRRLGPRAKAAAEARATPLAGMPRHAQPFAGRSERMPQEREDLRRRRAATSWRWCSA